MVFHLSFLNLRQRKICLFFWGIFSRIFIYLYLGLCRQSPRASSRTAQLRTFLRSSTQLPSRPSSTSSTTERQLSSPPSNPTEVSYCRGVYSSLQLHIHPHSHILNLYFLPQIFRPLRIFPTEKKRDIAFSSSQIDILPQQT